MFGKTIKLIWNLLFLCAVDDTLEVNSEEDVPEDSSFLEAIKQMKQKRYENIVDLCTQEIEKGLYAVLLL